MNLAVTLVIQGIVFFVVAWAVMKFIWPSIMTAIEDAAEENRRGSGRRREEREGPDRRRGALQGNLREARDRAAQILDQAGKRSNEMVDEAKGTASSEAQRLLAQARDEAARESYARARRPASGSGQARRRGRVAHARARDRPENSCRAARQTGGRDRAWLSEPPSHGLTRKRRSSTRATRRRSRVGRRGSKSRPRSSRIRAIAALIHNPRLTAEDLAGLISDVAGEKLDAGMRELRARARGESPLAAAAGNRGALRGRACPGREYRRRRGRLRRALDAAQAEKLSQALDSELEAPGAHAEFGGRDAAGRRGDSRWGSGHRRLVEGPAGALRTD